MEQANVHWDDGGPVADVGNAALPLSEIDTRTARAQTLMAEFGVECLLLYGSEGYPHGVRYFSGFWPSFESALVVLTQAGRPVLLPGPETEPLARLSVALPDIIAVEESGFAGAPDYAGLSAPSLAEAIAPLVAGLAGRRIHAYPFRAFPHSLTETLAASFPAYEVVSGDDIVQRIRRVKTDYEVARLRRASQLAEEVFASVHPRIADGMTETAVMDLANAGMAAGGSEAPAYYGWCASGPNTQNPIHRSTRRVIRDGDLVQLNIGPRIEGYSGSVGRALTMGGKNKSATRLIADGLAIAARTAAETRAGIPASTVAMKVGAEMEARGYSALYGPAHGTGMEECELPWIQRSSEFVLEPNMSFNIDIWLERDGHGLRVEDGIIVTPDGCDVLSPRFHEVISQ